MMGGQSEPRTSASLLLRLNDPQQRQQAWSEFFARYGPFIYGCCRRACGQQADAEDVTQTVLLKLTKTMHTFVYDPKRRFRGWLSTVVHNAIADHHRGRRRDRERWHPESLDAFEGPDTWGAVEGRLDLEIAEEFVRQRVSATTWEAYVLTVRSGLSHKQAADQIQAGFPEKMSVGAVTQARFRVVRLIKEFLSAEGSGAAACEQ